MIMRKRRYSAVVSVLLSAPVLAANSGFNKANETLSNTSTGLLGLAAVTITLATMWVGYKVLFDGKSLHDMRNIIIGAILIVGASGFGAYWAS
ncbi:MULTISPECIES: TrbC/VirB2 family protein [Enterobacterales]|jgi:type IV secretion system protein VirB2|uniref:TrbC/VirB2 family protein n=4 Tax=Enterobacteriaceae TaxID=543 RepID=A0A624CYQ7_SALSE|nr:MULTISPECIES: TrbC/VirB2 family protein [Enterobacterales]EAA7299373.1 conjugal transfer protein [Salmonella enterica subsp. arizonae]EAA9442450.1 conjugal transfer protein [Salmonella enterica subsp. enterica]EAN4565719.1 conjugal transfer protein [Salmonella enterica subsp. enterica serovar Senftenberg]EBH2825872.1 TrbC/VirB2 family protein [Salmonella enterica subsp. enterica serovar Mbandaka]EBK2491811.1 TrbC/VirB2 family protein [Salmonella enterica subsp. enterica serovar Typhimurium]